MYERTSGEQTVVVYSTLAIGNVTVILQQGQIDIRCHVTAGRSIGEICNAGLDDVRPDDAGFAVGLWGRAAIEGDV